MEFAGGHLWHDPPGQKREHFLFGSSGRDYGTGGAHLDGEWGKTDFVSEFETFTLSSLRFGSKVIGLQSKSLCSGSWYSGVW